MKLTAKLFLFSLASLVLGILLLYADGGNPKINNGDGFLYAGFVFVILSFLLNATGTLLAALWNTHPEKKSNLGCIGNALIMFIFLLLFSLITSMLG